MNDDDTDTLDDLDAVFYALAVIADLVKLGWVPKVAKFEGEPA